MLGVPWLSASSAALGLNSSSAPTSSQKLYLSFSHRDEPAFAITALGLFNDTSPNGGNVNDTLPTDRIKYGRAWKTSEILPFLGHVGIERLSCSGPGLNGTAGMGPNTNTSGAAMNTTGTYVRVLVNSAPIPLPACAGADTGPGGSCSMSTFNNFVQGRVNQYGNFKTACRTTNGSDTISFYGNITMAMGAGAGEQNSATSTMTMSGAAHTEGSSASASASASEPASSMLSSVSFKAPIPLSSASSDASASMPMATASA